jgi:hypothetical protein
VNEREAAAVVKTPSTIPTFDGEPCKLFITNYEVDAQGEQKKKKLPHPVYQRVKAAQSVYDNLHTKPLDFEGIKWRLDTIVMSRMGQTSKELKYGEFVANVK